MKAWDVVDEAVPREWGRNGAHEVASGDSQRARDESATGQPAHSRQARRPPRRDAITPAAETTIAGLTIAEIRPRRVLGGLISHYERAA